MKKFLTVSLLVALVMVSLVSAYAEEASSLPVETNYFQDTENDQVLAICLNGNSFALLRADPSSSDCIRMTLDIFNGPTLVHCISYSTLLTFDGICEIREISPSISDETILSFTDSNGYVDSKLLYEMFDTLEGSKKVFTTYEEYFDEFWN